MELRRSKLKADSYDQSLTLGIAGLGMRAAATGHELQYRIPVIFSRPSCPLSMGLILLIILVVLLIGATPTWPYSRGWGYYPSGGLGLVIVIVLVLWLLHVI